MSLTLLKTSFFNSAIEMSQQYTSDKKLITVIHV